AQHGFYRSVVGYPPVRRIVGIFLLDEVHRRKIGIVKNVFRPKRIVVSPLAHSFRSSNHGLKQQLAADLLDHSVECQQRISQVVKDTHEEHKIELARTLVDRVHGSFLQFNLQSKRLGGKARLVQVTILHIDAEHPRSEEHTSEL